MHLPLALSSFVLTASAVLGDFSPAPFLLSGEYQLSADLDGEGSFSRASFRARAGVPLFLGEDATIVLSGNYQFDSFQFDDLPVDPWEQVHRSRLGIVARQKLANGWSWIALPWLTSNAERGADFEDSLTAGLISATWYEYSEGLKLGLGVVVSGRLEDNVVAFPIPVIDWEFAENWTFSTLPQEGFRIGAGATLRWDARDDVSLALIYQFSNDQQRLDENSQAVANGVGEFSQHRVSLATTYRCTENLSLTGHIGVTFGGELELQNSNGDRLEERDFDSSLIFGLAGTWRF